MGAASAGRSAGLGGGPSGRGGSVLGILPAALTRPATPGWMLTMPAPDRLSAKRPCHPVPAISPPPPPTHTYTLLSPIGHAPPPPPPRPSTHHPPYTCAWLCASAPAWPSAGPSPACRIMTSLRLLSSRRRPPPPAPAPEPEAPAMRPLRSSLDLWLRYSLYSSGWRRPRSRTAYRSSGSRLAAAVVDAACKGAGWGVGGWETQVRREGCPQARPAASSTCQVANTGREALHTGRHKWAAQAQGRRERAPTRVVLTRDTAAAAPAPGPGKPAVRRGAPARLLSSPPLLALARQHQRQRQDQASKQAAQHGVRRGCPPLARRPWQAASWPLRPGRGRPCPRAPAPAARRRSTCRTARARSARRARPPPARTQHKGVRPSVGEGGGVGL